MMFPSSSWFIIGAILIGFVLYLSIKDSIFGTHDAFEGYEPNPHPAKGPVEIRQEPIAPPRTVAASGPNPPAQSAPNGEVVIYGEPAPADPYSENAEASNAPENMRYPERSFRPAPANDVDGLAVESGIAGGPGQNSSQAYQKFSAEPIQNSGEFMNGVFANDTLSDTNFSAF
jgi:hypothetical protein